MLKKMLALTTLSLAVLAVPSLAQADPRGRYETRVVVVREWVPAQSTRIKVRVWVPPRIEYVNETRIIRQATISYDSCGRPVHHPAVTRVVRVPRHVPGFYRDEWQTRVIPGHYRNVRRQQRVFVPYAVPRHAGPKVVVTTPKITTRSIEREVSRSASKTGKEIRRAGRRINKEIKRIFD